LAETRKNRSKGKNQKTRFLKFVQVGHLNRQTSWDETSKTVWQMKNQKQTSEKDTGLFTFLNDYFWRLDT